MLHIAQHLQRIEHVLMARRALQVGHESDATTILLIGRIIETLLLRKSNLSCLFAHVQQKMYGETTMPGCLGLSTFPCPNPAFHTVRLAKGQRTASAKKDRHFSTAQKMRQHLNF